MQVRLTLERGLSEHLLRPNSMGKSSLMSAFASILQFGLGARCSKIWQLMTKAKKIQISRQWNAALSWLLWEKQVNTDWKNNTIWILWGQIVTPAWCTSGVYWGCMSVHRLNFKTCVLELSSSLASQNFTQWSRIYFCPCRNCTRQSLIIVRRHFISFMWLF